MANGKPKRRTIGGIRGKVLNIPKGRASALPRGNIITKGLRGKKPLAQRVVAQAKFSRRTGIAPKTIGFVGRRKKKRGLGFSGGQVLGFRSDGRLP